MQIYVHPLCENLRVREVQVRGSVQEERGTRAMPTVDTVPLPPHAVASGCIGQKATRTVEDVSRGERGRKAGRGKAALEGLEGGKRGGAPEVATLPDGGGPRRARTQRDRRKDEGPNREAAT